MNGHDEYKKLDLPETPLEPCPCCASDVELWQYSASEDAPTSKAICCSFGDPFGPQEGMIASGCPLYMPPGEHYKATIREAVKFWNHYAKEFSVLQRKNRWNRAQVLRQKAPQ